MKTLKLFPFWLLSLALLIMPLQLTAQDDQAPPPPQDQTEPENGPPQQAPPAESPEQLQQLVAPIALYPDALVAQILNASTYPTQLVEAHRWLQDNSGLSGDQLAQAVDSQPWDPSVKALLQYPSVLENMDKNLSWTSSLGDAYYNQQQDVMDAIQVMRKRAQDAGNLRNSPQEVVSDDGGQIAIQPANTSVVYVPIYDPWYAYGPPVAVWPGFVYTTWWVPRPFFGFSVGFPIGFWGHFGWGWPAWRLDWRAHNVWYRGGVYVSHSPAFFDRRGYYGRGGPRYYAGARPEFRGGQGRVAEPRGGREPEFRGQPGRAEGPRVEGRVDRPAPNFRPAPNVGRGFGAPQGQRGVRSGAFTGVQHGGDTRSFASRGRASFGGGGGSRGGGSHGGGGRSSGGGGKRK